jgi:uncharacterized protein (TIRG00374 family)
MRWKLVVGLLLSGAFLYLAFRGARFAEIAAALRSANYLWMIPMVALTLFAFALRAWRWRYLLAGVHPVPFGPLFSSTMIGFMGNNLLPARLGELLRVYSIGHAAGISRSAALGSIVLERILDIFVLLLLFATVLVSGRLPGEVRGWGGYLLGVSTPILIGLILFRVRANLFLSLIRRFAPAVFRDRLLHIAANFREGLSAMSRSRELLLSIGLSLVMWNCLVGVVVCTFRSMGLVLPPAAGVVVLVIMAIGTMLPSAPGFIGTLQYAGTLALLQYGVDRSVALSFTLIYHASQWFPVTLIGLVFFFQQQLTLRQLERVARSGSGQDRPITELGGSGPEGGRE